MARRRWLDAVRLSPIIRERLDALRPQMRDRRTMTVTFSVLAVIVAMLVGVVLHMRALAQTHELRYLDCPVASGVGHIHDENCFDEEGNLVCTLDEVPIHYHDESCYDEEGNLVCGLEESGEVHQHGSGCFRTVVVDNDGNIIDSEATPEGVVAVGPDTESAKVHYKADLRERLADGSEHVVVSVEADAPANALPDGTKLYVDRLMEEKPDETPSADEGDAEAVSLGGEEKKEGALSEAELDAKVKADTALVERASEKAVEKIEDKAAGKVTDLLALDISFRDAEGKRVEPAEKVAMRVSSDILGEDADSYVVRFDGNGEPALVNKLGGPELESRQIEEKPGELVFETKADEPCAVAVASTDQTLETGGGETFESMRVDAAAAAGVPRGSELRVSEIGADTEGYDDLVQQASEALGGQVGNILLYDISIVRGDDEVQPQEAVGVNVTLAPDAAERFDGVRVVHFGADGPEVVDANKDGQVVSFEATGFSAYAIVDGPEPVAVGWRKVTSMDEFLSLTSEGIAISSMKGIGVGTAGFHFFTNEEFRVNNTRTGIKKTMPASATPPSDMAVYYFEPVSGTDNQFYAYCYGDDGVTRRYVQNSGNNSLRLTDENNRTAFTVTFNGSYFLVNNGAWYWNMQAGVGDGGRSFCSYNNATDEFDRLYFWKHEGATGDPYDLDGKAYGLMRWDGTVLGKALQATSSHADHLDALPLTVMTEKTDDEDKLFVPDNSGATMWTFEWVSDDTYYLKADVDGSTKYLAINADGLSMVDSAAETTPITVVPGTGAHAGEISLSAGGKTLTYTGDKDLGFKVGGAAGSEWLHLVEESELTDDYFMTHTAEKISVSAPEVTTGTKLIVYTRIWNEETSKYECYAIDHDGSLKRCYESGDEIQWVGSNVNTLLWEFTEHKDAESGQPNFYYELYNQYAEKYLAPLNSTGQIMASDPIGINLNGRREGKYYSPIVAWDDGSYAYSGITVSDDKTHILPCPNTEAVDFFFATVVDKNEDEDLTTVNTLDNDQYGIKMRLVNFGTREEMKDMMGTDNNWSEATAYQAVEGLLSRELADNGYPTATHGDMHNLGEYYARGQEVNHLFIESIHGGSGYYVYDSAQNFASLQSNGDFKVYKEIGTYDTSSRATLKHGQFFPYNDIEAGHYAVLNGKNEYKVDGTPLDENDPRRNERLYLLKDKNGRFGNADTQFALELEASFVQTPNGLDEWGHDIIYEFTGDDDFWLYVDGQLVIDLGGVHSALAGTVNFAKGTVVVNGKPTTLREIFEENYRASHLGADDATVNAYLDGIFKDGGTVFKDNTTHTMRIFYMERGGGASNLNMRFNLSSIRPGSVLLSKELDGVDKSESVPVEYPYQIFYRPDAEAQEVQVDGQNVPVVYKDTDKSVTHRDSLSVGGTTYQDVFMLKPSEIAEIKLPDSAHSYRIVECGVSSNIYESVSVAGNEIEGTPRQGAYKDYEVTYEDPKTNAAVAYKNKVKPEALRSLTFTKELYEADGTTKIAYDPNDPTRFNFRLSFGSEFDESLTLANMMTYHVKDPNGCYCTWDAASGTFVPVVDAGTQAGKTNYDDLTDDEKVHASFTTSMNGAIANIPNGFTIEMRAVLIGTRYKVEERSNELPDGYSLQGYRLNDTTDGSGNPLIETTPIEEQVHEGEDPNVQVRNLKGYGLRVNKTWMDQDYMTRRDPTYFAVFVNRGDNQEPELVSGSARRLNFDEDTLYWYFLTLPVAGTTFDDYVIYEVDIKNPVVDENGVVTHYSSLKHIVEPDQQHHPGGENEFQLLGRQKGESTDSHFKYTVDYERGTVQAGSNVRVDEATNVRPGVAIEKTDWDGSPLKGATFTLSDETGAVVGTFTSNDEGVVTTAFLRPEVTYTLTETKSPQGFQGLPAEMTIVQNHNDTLSVGGVEQDWYVLDQTHGAHGHRSLTIKDCPFDLEVVKVNADTRQVLSGVEFALYKEVVVGNVTTMKPVEGYESLMTDANGIVPGIDATLPPANYELREVTPKSGYKTLRPHLRFTISETGVVSLTQRPTGTEFTDRIDNGTLVYTVTIPNEANAQKVELHKVDGQGNDLAGATFELLKWEGSGAPDSAGGGSWVQLQDNIKPGDASDPTAPVPNPVELGDDPMGLGLGAYRLRETDIPDGYVTYDSTTDFFVELDAQAGGLVARLADGTSQGVECTSRVEQDGTVIYTITIPNNSGSELPHSGGAGTAVFYAFGAVLAAAGALHLARQRRDVE